MPPLRLGLDRRRSAGTRTIAEPNPIELPAAWDDDSPEALGFTLGNALERAERGSEEGNGCTW